MNQNQKLDFQNSLTKIQMETAKSKAFQSYKRSKTMTKLGQGSCVIDFDEKYFQGMKLAKTIFDKDKNKDKNVKRCSLPMSIGNFKLFSNSQIKGIILVQDQECQEPCRQCYQWLQAVCSNVEDIQLSKYYVDSKTDMLNISHNNRKLMRKKEEKKQKKGGLGNFFKQLF